TGAYVEDTFTVTVNAVNDAPTVDNAIADVTVSEDAANTVLDLSQAFADVDILTNSDDLTLTVVGNTNSSLVGTALSGNTLTLDYVDNQNGVANITIRATDSTGAYVEDTFTVTVNAVNDAPTVDNAIADVTVSEDASNTVLDLSQAFADVDILTNSDNLTLEVISNTNTSLVGASLSGNTLTLDYADNQNGVANITIRATDSTGAYVEDTFTVTVNAVNDAPTVDNGIADVTVNEDAANTVLDLSQAFADVDILTNRDDLTLTVVGNTNRSLVGTALSGNSLTLDYAENQHGVANITIRATDSTGAFVEDTFKVTVSAVNDAPVVNSAISDITVNGDTSNSVIDLSSVFSDVDLETNSSEKLTLTVVGNTNNSLVNTSISGNILTLGYADNQTGVASITIRATDSGGLYVETTFNVEVTAATSVDSLNFTSVNSPWAHENTSADGDIADDSQAQSSLLKRMLNELQSDSKFSGDDSSSLNDLKVVSKEVLTQLDSDNFEKSENAESNDNNIDRENRADQVSRFEFLSDSKVLNREDFDSVINVSNVAAERIPVFNSDRVVDTKPVDISFSNVTSREAPFLQHSFAQDDGNIKQSLIGDHSVNALNIDSKSKDLATDKSSKTGWLLNITNVATNTFSNQNDSNNAFSNLFVDKSAVIFVKKEAGIDSGENVLDADFKKQFQDYQLDQ
ncbi:MAG: Ig-like domain-containing protein, partial [Chlamydiota bacterium]|nr:Ig-like domain-containing protein [Chlamydiota bacterium]